MRPAQLVSFDTFTIPLGGPHSLGFFGHPAIHTILNGLGTKWTECGACQTRSAQRKCAGCGLVAYCNRTCQRAHWHSRHRDECSAHPAGSFMALPFPVPAYPVDAFLESLVKARETLLGPDTDALAS